MHRAGYRELTHPADLALEVYGRDLCTLFQNAACGLQHLLRCTPADPIPETPGILITLHAPDLETLLVDWLGELLYLTEQHGHCWIVRRVQVTPPATLTATIGLAHDGRPQRSIKAVTFSGLAIVKAPDGFETVIVFDV
ncbi:MAG: archease, partial [Anaerolineae bacterium]